MPEQPQTKKKEESADQKPKDPQSGNVKVKEKEKKEVPKKNAIDETKWSWKIAGKNIKEKWNETELHIPSATPITITVYNNGKETPVVWDWNGATSLQTPYVKSRITELSSITITRNSSRSGKGIISLYPKGQPEKKQTLKVI